MVDILSKSILFEGIDPIDIEEFIKASHSFKKTFKKDEVIFHADETPKYIYILLSGSVSINKTTYAGNSIMLTSIEKPGEMFGEVYAFLNNHSYSFFTVSNVKNTEILFIPNSFFTMEKSLKIYNNLLKIFAEKAFFLTEKVKILSAGSLRQKLSILILSGADEKNTYTFKFSRESLASYLGVARPSLSRELKNMVDDELIQLNGKKVKILDISKLEKLVYK